MSEYPDKLASWLGIWGVINLILAFPYGVLILIFAVAIYITKSPMIMNAFGWLWLILAIPQFFAGFMFPWLFILAIINAIFAIGVISETKKYEKGKVVAKSKSGYQKNLNLDNKSNMESLSNNYCSECNYKLNKKDKFCPDCGNKVYSNIY
ncbi:zinc ribbon domain-containing protein [Methanobacterium spitsbergense]|uniref:Zinc-ribbon domain-containing protein n=1 Tax=Methanobacterium spitsbergense TaxID=2874285 RepID=A0A8T5UQ47_9EURY|nr:zinc ribbon domain-containing protein [Methanobacterium spitsbergense]MBZ2165908.1 hypothetical protein [Methanobacterium spitsbergense]